MDTPVPSLDFSSLRDAYRRGVSPREVMQQVCERIAATADNPVWIATVAPATIFARAEALTHAGDVDSLPLFGLPFAVKDNIDVAGMPTTAACPDFAYTPAANAPVVDDLLAAGAILIGKTNLDQFATGLVGTRSPYGAVQNAFNPAYISGGSSSGSAVAVANGTVSFALGTDTAGSGRVPAGFNNLVGLKPTRGVMSTTGLVPACRSLDAVSIFALTSADAKNVFAAASGYDAGDSFARVQRRQIGGPAGAFRCGIPTEETLEFCQDHDAAEQFSDARAHMQSIGAAFQEIDLTPFLEVAQLLYSGPWVAERYVAIRQFFDRKAKSIHPVVRSVIGEAAKYSAADAFEAGYRLAVLRRQIDAQWGHIDCLLVPTAPTIYTISEVESDPVDLNTALGYYTNFVNLLDLCAIALPAGFRSDGLPSGITLIAPPLHDDWLCDLGARFARACGLPLGATGAMPGATAAEAPPGSHVGNANGYTAVAVAGAHLSGQPLNHQLTERGARLARSCRTAPVYRMFALEGALAKPGLIRGDQGSAIEVEVWEVPTEAFGSFVAAIPPPLGIGTLALDDGSEVKGFICEAHAVAGARDISEFGSWRNYLAVR
jgi:allophanate hydrolase